MQSRTSDSRFMLDWTVKDETQKGKSMALWATPQQLFETHRNSRTSGTDDSQRHASPKSGKAEKKKKRRPSDRTLLLDFRFPNTGHTTNYSQTPKLELATEITRHKVEGKKKN